MSDGDDTRTDSTPTDDTPGDEGTAGGAVIQLASRREDRDDVREDDAAEGDTDGGEAAAEDAPETGQPTVVVDQRMRLRRIAVRRDAGLRRLRRLGWLLVPVAVLVVGVALAQTPWLDVDHVVVEGATQSSGPGVQQASGVDRGDPLLTLDEGAAAERVERLTWVADAEVTREWPSTVRIRVTERIPAVAVERVVGDQTGADPVTWAALVDSEGRVLDLGRPVPAGMVLLTGVEGPLREGTDLPDEARAGLELAQALAEQLPGVAASVSTDLEVTLNVGGVARFGSVEDLSGKLMALETVLQEVVNDCLAVVDLRVPSNIAVTRTC